MRKQKKFSVFHNSQSHIAANWLICIHWRVLVTLIKRISYLKRKNFRPTDKNINPEKDGSTLTSLVVQTVPNWKSTKTESLWIHIRMNFANSVFYGQTRGRKRPCMQLKLLLSVASDLGVFRRLLKPSKAFYSWSNKNLSSVQNGKNLIGYGVVLSICLVKRGKRLA